MPFSTFGMDLDSGSDDTMMDVDDLFDEVPGDGSVDMIQNDGVSVS